MFRWDSVQQKLLKSVHFSLGYLKKNQGVIAVFETQCKVG